MIKDMRKDTANKSEELKLEYEEQYRAQIDEYKAKIQQQELIIENHNKEVATLKEDEKEKDTRIDMLEEESKKIETVIELIKSNENASKGLFEFYKSKTA